MTQQNANNANASFNDGHTAIARIPPKNNAMLRMIESVLSYSSLDLSFQSLDLNVIMHLDIVIDTIDMYIKENTEYTHTFHCTNASHIPKKKPAKLSMLAKIANNFKTFSLNFPFQATPISRLHAQHHTVSNESHCVGNCDIAVLKIIGLM